jgi:hypothetical protein
MPALFWKKAFLHLDWLVLPWFPLCLNGLLGLHYPGSDTRLKVVGNNGYLSPEQARQFLVPRANAISCRRAESQNELIPIHERIFLILASDLHFLKKRPTLHGQGHKTLGQLEDFSW